MKIALCHHYSMSFWSGGEKLLLDLARKLLSDGFNVEIHSIPVGKRNLKPPLEDIIYDEKWLHNIDADIAYFIYSPYIEHFFKFKNTTPKIASIHGFPLVPELQHKLITDISTINRIKNIGIFRSFIWYHSKYLRDFRNFDAIHVINPAIKDLYSKLNLCKKIYYIPNWVDKRTYYPCKDKDENFTVIYASRNEWVKGIDIYNEIAKKGKHLGIRFLATGNNGRGTNSKIHFDSMGFLKDNSLAFVYSNAHITVIPTRIDTFGNTITESLACGTPVITTRMPIHNSLQLPILYADSVGEFIYEIYKIKQVWEDDREKYCNFCSKCIDSITKYNFDKIYPQLKNMFYDVINK